MCLINVSSRYNMAHVVRGERHMLEVVVEGPEGLIVLPGGSGLQELTTLDDADVRHDFESSFRELEEYADVILARYRQWSLPQRDQLHYSGDGVGVGDDSGAALRSRTATH